MLAFALVLSGMDLTGGVCAMLLDRGGGMIYDDLLDITWLQNANYAAIRTRRAHLLGPHHRDVLVEGHQPTDARRDNIIVDVGSVAGHALVAGDFQTSGSTYTGHMTWWGAMAWAMDLEYGGFNDWRLATISLTAPDTTVHSCASGTAAGCKNSGNELGYVHYFNLGAGNNTGTQTADGVTLSNIQGSCSATAFDSISGGGFQRRPGIGYVGEDSGFFAWAVRPGDVAARGTGAGKPRCAPGGAAGVVGRTAAATLRLRRFGPFGTVGVRGRSPRPRQISGFRRQGELLRQAASERAVQFLSKILQH